LRWFCGVSTGKQFHFTDFPKPVMGRNISEASSPLWVCGSWQETEVIQVTEGHACLALIGNCLASYENIVIAFRNAVKKGDHNKLAELGGSYNIIIRDEIGIHIFTDVAGLKPIYYSLYKHYIVYSSCSVALRELTGAEISQNWLATNLICPGIRDLVHTQSPFDGVKSVPPGYVLQILPESVTCRKYWSEPQGDGDFLETAQKLRERLIAAVEGRACLYGSITSDLSGGMDSTSLSLIAARKLATQGRKLHTITVKSTSADGNEDLVWAQHAINLCSSIQPTIIDTQEFLPPFSDLESIPLIDEPSEIVISITKFRHMMEIVRKQKSRLHMNGEGGDAVLLASHAYLIDLFRRTQFKIFIRHAYGWARVFRCSPLSIINCTVKLSTTSYNAWLTQQAQRLIERREAKNSIFELLLAWSSPPQGINLYTKEAVYLVASELKKYSTIATPFLGGRGQHSSISGIHGIAYRARGMQQIAETYDVNLEFPYLDPPVVDACLQAKVEQRTTPFRYKPLLYEALRQDLPDSVLTRSTKVAYSSDIYVGIKKNLAYLNELFSNSQLSAMGLINLKEIDSTLMELGMGLPTNFGQFCTIVTTELWLRRILQNNYDCFWVKGS
jgi:asparagine synthase (glutamine-hydrolysing)